MTTTADQSTGQPVVASPNDERVRLAFDLYERFGKPLESAHADEFVAITPDGRTLLGTDLVETITRASATFGPGSFVFKVGERAVGTWR
jgi:hypothetical protein